MLAFSARTAEHLRASDYHIVVTGVGGWLGRATLEMLDNVLGNQITSRVSAFASSKRTVRLDSGRSIGVAPLDQLCAVEAGPSYVLHYAYLGKEKVAELGPERFASTNRAINDVVERYCERVRAGGLFFASSGAAYYATGSPEDVTREPYGASKVYDEARFGKFRRPSFTVATCRIFNLGGPYMNKVAEYALSCILLDLRKGGPIRLRANRPVVRSYTHVRDVVDLALALLVRGSAPAVPFDSAGEEEIEIGDLAVRAAGLLGAPDVRVERPEMSNLPPDRYAGDGARFESLLQETGIRRATLDEQILDTARYLGSVTSSRTS